MGNQKTALSFSLVISGKLMKQGGTLVGTRISAWKNGRFDLETENCVGLSTTSKRTIEGLSETWAESAAAFRSLKRVPGSKTTPKWISRITGSTSLRSRKAINNIGCLGVKLRRTKSPNPFLLSKSRDNPLEPFLPTIPALSTPTHDSKPDSRIEGRFERSVK